jgi:uncharacterized protein
VNVEPPAPTFLLKNLLHFGRLLHALGVDVQAGRMIEAAEALQHIEVGRRTDFYFTLRSVLLHRQQDLAVFDAAFRAFWRPPPRQWLEISQAPHAPRRIGTPQIEIPLAQPDTADGLPAETTSASVGRVAPTSYSAQDVSRVKDFADFTEAELDRARAIVATLTWDLGLRITRRWTTGRGQAVDWRSLVRRSLRYGGEAILVPRRERTLRPHPLVLLCDVSGSMERYTRMLLHFIHGLTSRRNHAEAFVFATRLTRITRELSGRARRRAVPAFLRLVPDWSGGTRIGDALRAFNVHWARRVMRHAPVVLLISDGWDRGEPEPLAREMSRLQRTSRRLIWLNPLLGSPDYRPLTRGMQAALPFVDDFLPVHNLASLESLAKHLNQLPERRNRVRSVRPQPDPGARVHRVRL